MTHSFTCALCKETFTSDPTFTEAERLAELQQHFGAVPAEERASVCEDCFRRIDPASNLRLVEEAVAEAARARLAQPVPRNVYRQIRGKKL